MIIINFIMGGHPRSSGLILSVLLVAGTVVVAAATPLDFPAEGRGEVLRQGDSEFEMVKLEPPMPFFSQSYDHIYVRERKAPEKWIILPSIDRGRDYLFIYVLVKWKLWPRF